MTRDYRGPVLISDRGTTERWLSLSYHAEAGRVAFYGVRAKLQTTCLDEPTPEGRWQTWHYEYDASRAVWVDLPSRFAAIHQAQHEVRRIEAVTT